MAMIQQFTKFVFSGCLPCDCKKCKDWDGVSNIVCENIECICEKAVVLKCEILSTPCYTCVDSYCMFHIGADNKYFKEYVHTMDESRRYLYQYVHSRITCLCGVLLKTCMEPMKQELQIYFTCRNGGCDYKRSIPQLKDSRIRCVCGRFCKHDGEIYKCSRGEAGCGTYFHELDSLTYMYTEMLQDELEDCAFAYLPKNVKRLKCGHYGILKYRSSISSENKYGKLVLICSSLFCDESTEAVIAPDFRIDE